MGPTFDPTNGNPYLKKLLAEGKFPGMAPPPPTAPPAIVDASKPRPITVQPMAPPPELRTSAKLPEPPSSLPSSTVDTNAVPAPPYERGTIGGEKAEENRLAATGSGIHQIKNPFLHGLAATADVLGQTFLPRLEMAIPGTEGHHQMLLGQQRGRIKDLETGEDEAAKRALTEAQTHHTEAQSGAIENPNPLKDELTEAQIEHLRNPATAAQRQPKVIKDSEGFLYRDSGDGEPVPLIVNGEHMKGQMPASPAPKQLADKAEYNNLLTKENLGQTLTPEEQARKKAIEQGIETFITKPGERRMTALGESRAVTPIDLETGVAHYDTLGHARATGNTTAPASIPFQTAKGVERAYTSGPQGQQLTAIATARYHMETFRKLAKALGNENDMQALNEARQAWKQQFGSPAPTNFNLAKEAFAAEVGRAFAVTNVTEGERNKVAESIKRAETPEQLSGAADTADELLAGKQRALKESHDLGVKNKPNFGKEGGSALPGGVTMDEINAELERRKGKK
jgi:hypothetical protein